MHKPTIYIIMGVSGCGKTTIGELLAKELELPYFDGDDFHSESNIKKMAAGQALDDSDRQGWLQALNTLAVTNSEKGAIIACSALKKIYREVLQETIEKSVCFIHLEGTFEDIDQRMQEREDHFMPAELLKSQFEDLEPPLEAIVVSIKNEPQEILQNILYQLQ